MPNQSLIRIIAILFAFTIALPATYSYANEGGEEGGEKAKDGPMYVDFKNIVVPVIRKNGSTGLVALTMMAEVKDNKAQDAVMNHIPKLRDAFIRTLYGRIDSNHFTRDDGALDVEQIKAQLMQTAQLVMKDKENPIQDILFQNIAQQTY